MKIFNKKIIKIVNAEKAPSNKIRIPKSIIDEFGRTFEMSFDLDKEELVLKPRKEGGV